jgi:hypothetical protein
MLVRKIIGLCAVLVLSGVSSFAFAETFTFSDALEYMDENGHVTIPDNYTSIGSSAFANTGVVSVTIPNTVTSMGSYSFENTPNLVEIVIPDSITEIPQSAFEFSGLSKITLHSNVTSIGSQAFRYSNIEEITLPDNIAIGNSAFLSVKFKHLKIPDGASLGSSSFNNIRTLISLEIGRNVNPSYNNFYYGSDNLKTLITGSYIGCNYGSSQGLCFTQSVMDSLEYVIIEDSVTSVNNHISGSNSTIVIKSSLPSFSSQVELSDILVVEPVNLSYALIDAPHSLCRDVDTDNDGHQDCYDQFPNDPDRWFDYSDSAETNTTELVHSDGDGLADIFDLSPTDGNQADSHSNGNTEYAVDTDGDGFRNDGDIDDDDDGLLDIYEPFFGTNPLIPDSDFDGTLDGLDAFPLDNTESLDTDSDGIGNNADTDDDNDGHFDLLDAFPFDANEWMDSDLDGVGNNADTDDDNDGVLDEEDAFPYTASESVDTDGDGVGDNADAFPNDSSETLDTDLDGIGNNADTDDDNDGVADAEDSDPLNDSIGALESQNLFVMGNPVAVNGYLTTISVGYDVSDANNQLNGIGFRVHYDSSIYNYSAVQNTLGESVVVDGMGPYQDVEDFDNDSTTDSYLVYGWAAMGGNWPNVELPAKLSDIEMFVNWADYDAASTTSNINFTVVDNNEGYDGEVTNYSMNVLPATWDFDGNGLGDALTDGLMLLRYTFGVTDIDMTADAIAENATLSATQVVEGMTRALQITDIDGNGSTDALTDGLLLMRYMFGLRGDVLILDSVSSDATRTTATDIEQYIALYMPDGLSSPVQSEQGFLVGDWKLVMPPEFRTYEDGELSDWYFGYAPSVHNDCVDDDIYSFDSNGSFNYSWNGTTYVPRDQNPEISFSSTPFSESDVVCDTPRAPWDDNETYSYIVDEDAGEIMLNGFGAFIAISHRANGNDEIDVPAEAPDSITYTYTKLTDDQVMLELDAYTEYWRFTLERVLGN